MNIHVIVKFCNKLIITDRKTLLLFFYGIIFITPKRKEFVVKLVISKSNKTDNVLCSVNN